MKKFFLLLLSLSFGQFLLFNIAFAQLSEGGIPISFKIDNQTLPAPDFEVMPTVDVNSLLAEDEIVDNQSEVPYRFGYNHTVNLNPDNSGVWTTLEDSSRLWRLGVKSEGALSINLTFDNYKLPDGANLFIYNEDKTHVIGAFTSCNNQEHRHLATTLIQGDAVVVEYYEPAQVDFQGELNLWRVTHGYRGPYDMLKGFGDSGWCNINVACPESDGWEDQINSVAIMVTGGNGFCTGSLVNNTNNDGTPYFLTADHCFSDPSTWVFWFNWQSATCDNPATAPGYDDIAGATLRARNAASDFCLVEINDDIPLSFNPFFSGWNRTTDNDIAGTIVGIHHPNGDIKKFSWADGGVTTTGYGGGAGTTHWEISSWSGETTTEPGSSGSAIWDPNGLLIGQLHGGAAACGNTQPDWYGKFSVSWTGGGTDDTRLSNWLDPNDTGETTWPGYDPNEILSDEPIADFSGNPTTVIQGNTVEFTDESQNNPTSWEWTFEQGEPDSFEGQNPPPIEYNTLGVWNVTLTVTNADGEDTEVKNNYIEVVEDGTLIANFSANPTSLTEGGNVQFTDESSGDPTSWQWEFEGGNPADSDDQNPEINYPTSGVYSVTLTVSDGTDTNEFIRTNYINVTPPGGGDLIANFVASTYNIIEGDCINFSDQSLGGPTGWSWSFPGAQTLTSTMQNPNNICYNNPGEYDVCLQVTRDGDTHTYCCDGCIVVNPDPNLPIANFVANQTVIPVGGVVMFTNLSENGPFEEWAWTFEGGVPYQVNDSTPVPIAYFEVGEYDVELRCKNLNGLQDVELKQNYIKVIPEATEPPTANFVANYTTINQGDAINFIDYSSGYPYNWSWEFENAETETSNHPNPTGIVYNTAGLHTVTLRVSNNFGADTLTKEQYIYVRTPEDTCTDAPIVKFTADRRLIPAGGTVGFMDLSENNPTNFSWTFPMGSPAFSNEASPTSRVRYNVPGIYSVTMSASNACGGDILTKNQYIYVFSGNVSQYCDTLSNIRAHENSSPQTLPELGWGFLAGHNGDNIREYADKFENYTFSHINGLIVPVSYAVYQDYNAQVTFYVWDGNSEKPDSVLGEKKMLIRNLNVNQANYITFDEPVEVDGPFFLGYRISYNNVNDANANDLFVVGIAPPRGTNPDNNTLYVKRGATWYSLIERYGFGSSLAIRPITCLVDMEEFIDDMNISMYPNPTRGIVNLHLGDLSHKDVEIHIYDLMGRKLNMELIESAHGEYQIYLKNNPDGMYIVRIKADGFVINKKLLLSK